MFLGEETTNYIVGELVRFLGGDLNVIALLAATNTPFPARQNTKHRNQVKLRNTAEINKNIWSSGFGYFPIETHSFPLKIFEGSLRPKYTAKTGRRFLAALGLSRLNMLWRKVTTVGRGNLNQVLTIVLAHLA